MPRPAPPARPTDIFSFVPASGGAVIIRRQPAKLMSAALPYFPDVLSVVRQKPLQPAGFTLIQP